MDNHVPQFQPFNDTGRLPLVRLSMTSLVVPAILINGTDLFKQMFSASE